MDKSQEPPGYGMAAPPYPGPPLNHPQHGQSVVVQYNDGQTHVIEAGQQVVVVKQLPTVAPGEMTCPHCRKSVMTEVSYKSGSCTWLCCFLIGCFLCWPCCWIPFCVKDYKDVEHYCPDCHQLLHFYKRR